MESSLRRCFPCSNCWDFILTHKNHESQVDNSTEVRDEASTSSGHQSKVSQESIERISDGLYRFYEPKEPRSANLDIFFFHALECEGANVQDAHISSWRSSSKPEVIWPQKWLSHDFPHSRIISISYDCCTKQTDKGGRMDMYRITENLLQEIVWARKEHDCYRPLIFVGHGFGGIVMKQLCVYAHNRKENLVDGRDVRMVLDSIRGFFFYATPHRGVEGLKPLGKKYGPLLRWMYALNEELARLDEAFCNLKQLERYRWIIFSVAGQDSTLGRPGLRLREGSSRYGDNYITVTSSHFSVCRPSSRYSNEYQHLQTLIQGVLSRVELEGEQCLTLPKVLVGFDGLITEVLGEHLRIHASVGVCGMGGVGKTTLAKLIFNKACGKFEFTCFVEQIKGLSGPKSEMKKKVWEQMRHRGVPVRKADQVYADGWYRVKGRSLLVIFDDVDSYQHTELLREIAENNGCVESRFIMTSRNSQVLREAYGDDVHIIRLDHLGNEDAKKLLTAYAFPKEQEPPESLRKIAQEVIDGCEGLPLTLEILGKHLRHQPLELWAEIPSALRRCTKDIADLEQRLWARLKLSYDGLPGDEVKNMFLDIASFFVQNNEWVFDSFSADDAVMAWSSIYGSVHNRLKILGDRSLVTVRRYEDAENRSTRTEFYMHEHLRRMGQKIATEEGRSLDLSQISSSAEPTSEDQNYTKLYPFDEEVVVQGGREELGKIVAHKIKISRNSMVVAAQSCSFCIMHEIWSKIVAIQFMDLFIDVTDRCEQCRSGRVPLPSTLVLLRLFPGMKHVLAVEAGGNSAGDVTGALSLSTCTSLVRLGLYSCKILGELTRLRQLRVLVIHSSQGVGNWLKSLGELRRLENLMLSRIKEPLELPVSFGHLSALQYLTISHCEVRSSIPASFTKLTNLGFLKLDEIVGEQAVSVGSFPQLRVLKMKCWAIADLAKVFRGLTALESLELELEHKEAVPFRSLELDEIVGEQAISVGSFPQLRVFKMKCWAIADLAKVFRGLTALESLELELEHTEAVPDIFGHLENLRRLALKCSGLENNLVESWGKLTSLEYLFLSSKNRSSELKVTLDLQSDQRSLEISLEGQLAAPGIFEPLPVFLTRVEDFVLVCEHGSTAALARKMINLKHLALTVDGQQLVEDIFGDLQNLRKFKLACSGIENNVLESLGNRITLEELTIKIKGQQTVRDTFQHLQNLRKFKLVCSGVENSLVESLGNLISLEDLTIEVQDQQVVQDIFGHLQNLRRFRLVCSGIENNLVESWRRLTRLEYLFLSSKNRTSELEVTLDLRCAPRRLEISLQGQLALPGILESLSVFLTRVEAFELVSEDGPTIVVVKNMISLKHLAVTVYSQEPVQDIFGDFQNLRKLKLACSGIEDSLVESLGNMINLEELTLEIEGQQTVRDIFGHLQNVRKFQLVCSGVENSLVKSLRNMISLEKLTIEVQGQQAIRDVFGHLQNLRKFRLVCSVMENNLMGSLGKLNSLEELHVNSKHESAELEITYRLQMLKIRLKGYQADSSILEPLPVFLREVNELVLKCEHGAQTVVVRNMIHLESFRIVVEGPGAVPDVFGDLRKLRAFSLTCHAVEDNLEGSFRALSSLRQLSLRCKTLEHFPQVLGCSSTLEHVWISCPSLPELPITVGSFIKLRKLRIFATGLQSLPDSVGQLFQLRELSILECNHLTTLPESLGQLQGLVRLKVRQCQNLKTLPESIGQLSSLRCLDFEGSALHYLPDSFKNLSQLRRLNISGCNNLDLSSLTIERFPQLEYESDGSSGLYSSYDSDSLSESGRSSTLDKSDYLDSSSESGRSSELYKPYNPDSSDDECGSL